MVIAPSGNDNEEVPAEIRELAQRRWDAKQEKDWESADRFRDELLAQGWEVKDGKDGFELTRATA